MEDTFVKLCREGKLDELKEMYKTHNINVNYDNAFIWSCCCNNLNVAQWLYSLGGVDIHTNNEEAFGWSCIGTRTELVKWLLSIDKFDNKIVDKYLPTCFHEFAFDQGYLPINNMVNTYAEYKNKIKNKIKEKHENGNIGVFELSYLVDIIMIYV